MTMALDKLSRAYRQRISYPELHESFANFGTAFLGKSTEELFGIAEPERIARVMLIFGYFDGSERMQCQPWIGIAAGRQIPLHADAHWELTNRHRTTRELPFDGNDPALSGHFWDMYVGSKNTPAPDSYTAYVGLAMHQNILQEEKLDAVATATEPGQVLEDHVICAKFDALNGQTVRIENGNIHTLHTTQQRTN